MWGHMTDHSFPAIFSKSTVTMSTRIRLLFLSIREQVGCRLMGRRTLTVLIPTMNHEKVYNLFSGADCESVASVMSDNLCSTSRKY